MSEEPANGERKVVVRRIIRRERDNFFGVDLDTIHWVITGLSIAGLGALVAKDYLKQQQDKRDAEAFAAAEASQVPVEQPQVQQVPQQPQPQQNPETFYPDNMSNTISHPTLDDGNSGTYVTDADGTRRKIRSRFGDMISVA